VKSVHHCYSYKNNSKNNNSSWTIDLIDNVRSNDGGGVVMVDYP
jgi:hypothetical protein